LLARQITGCIAVGCAITFVTVGAMAFWMADKYDRQAASASRTMMAGHAVNAWQKLAETTSDYAWRNDALPAYRRKDKLWLDANIGRAVTERSMAEIMVILSPTGEVEYVWGQSGEENPRHTISTDVATAIKHVMQPWSRDNSARTLLARGPGGVLTIGAARLAPRNHEGEPPGTLPILAVASYLSSARLLREGRGFFIDDLSVIPTAEPGKEARPLRDINDQVMGYLAWTPKRPGRELLETIFPPLAAALLLFSVVMGMVAVRGQRLVNALGAAARQDPLTGLENRKGLNDFLDTAACRDAMARGQVAAIYVDVNGFKNVNDTVGHQGGDSVVCEVAQRLKDALPEAHVARMGGDEFVAVFTGQDARHVARLAARLPRAMQKPFEVAGMEFWMSCAVGYSQCAGEGGSAVELIRRADIAMYNAKSLGQKEPLAYQPSMDAGKLEKKHFENKLRAALANGELRVVYQPIARARDGAVHSLEALVRWRSPDWGDVSPEKLVSVAEESGFIREIGDFVLARVCEDLVHWPDLRIAVNVSPSQLREANYVRTFRQKLKKHGVQPGQIEIELTENVLLNDPLPVARKLTHLRRLGVTVSLDDFGTGFSSIGSLRSFPLDRLKIDRSFIRDVATDARAAALARSFIAVADALRLDVVCEGVETQEQAQTITASGAAFLQGYFLSRPLEVDEARAYVGRSKKAVAA